MNAADERDNLGAFLKFADDLKEIRDHYERPVYSQTCRCGGSVEVGKDCPPGERRRIVANFFGMHIRCQQASTEDTTGGMG